MLQIHVLNFLIVITFSLAPLCANGGIISNMAPESRYSRSHSLGDSYEFDSRDGWETVNVTDLSYKYNDATKNVQLAERSITASPFAKDSTAGRSIIHDLWNGLKALGAPQSVTITWYTGYDLLNPSCWPQPIWSPTDASFACALTLLGWVNRPQCFKFIELCNGPQKCVFVRVVDTCAGCAPGSKHVDLTKAAFGQLADISQGVLTVQMRGATEPDEWVEQLWGPKVA